MQYNKVTLKIMSVIKLATGLVLALAGSYRFFQHHFDFRLIKYSLLTLSIIFIVSGIKGLYRFRTVQPQ